MQRGDEVAALADPVCDLLPGQASLAGGLGWLCLSLQALRVGFRDPCVDPRGRRRLRGQPCSGPS